MDAVTFQQEAMRYQRLLYHVSYAILRNDQDCADAIQEALLKAWQHAEELRDESRFRPWLTRILVNTCNSMVRKHASLRLVPLDETVPERARDDLPLRDALERLSPPLRLVTVLHYVEGFSVREVSDMAGVPEGTVKTRLMYARQRLQTMLGEEVSLA